LGAGVSDWPSSIKAGNRYNALNSRTLGMAFKNKAQK
jgi:hypothetical protein